MLKLMWYFTLLQLVAFAASQRSSRSTRRLTSTTTTTQSPDYGDYSDSAGPPPSSAVISSTRKTTTTATTQVKVNRRPANRGSKPVIASGSAFSSSSSSKTKTITAGASGPLSVQNQDAFAALDTLRGRSTLQSDEILEIMYSARPGTDFPILSSIPDATTFQCQNQKQPGFYADPDFQCQVFRRCDPSGNLFSFLCPNTTMFNQITLTCDYWFNVDCSKAAGFYDFSNSRLYHETWPLLGSGRAK